MRRIAALIGLMLVAACAAVVTGSGFASRFGAADTERFDVRVTQLDAPSYEGVIQPILDRRCVVCHACNDAPCQLKTTSWEGLARGASKTPVYDATRLLAAAPSRLGIDADKASEWRERDFFAVLNEHAPTVEANRTAGLMHRLLALKQQHPLPAGEVADASLDFSINREASCPAGIQIDATSAPRRSAACPSACRAWPRTSTGRSRTGSSWGRLPAPRGRRHRSRCSAWRSGSCSSTATR